jgi:hypothetical protein
MIFNINECCQAITVAKMMLQVGHTMILNLNLTRMASTQADKDCCSHAFMSVQDFLSVASAHKGVLIQLLERFPDVIHALWKGSDLYQHVMQLFDAVQQHSITLYLDSVWRSVLNTTGGNSSTGFTGAELKAVRRIVRDHQKQIAMFHVYSEGSVVSRGKAAAPETTVRLEQVLQQPLLHASGGGMQRLLEQQQASMSTVDTYSSLVASSKGFSNLAIASFKRSSDKDAPLVTETWLEGPFGWQPKYGTLAEAGQCPAVEQLIESTGEVLRVVKTYYANDFAAKVKMPPWDFGSNVPVMFTPESDREGSEVEGPLSGSGSSILYGTALQAVHSYAPWMEDSASSFFTLRRGSDVHAGQHSARLHALQLRQRHVLRQRRRQRHAHATQHRGLRRDFGGRLGRGGLVRVDAAWRRGGRQHAGVCEHARARADDSAPARLRHGVHVLPDAADVPGAGGDVCFCLFHCRTSLPDSSMSFIPGPGVLAPDAASHQPQVA